jgi:hypothetical protein
MVARGVFAAVVALWLAADSSPASGPEVPLAQAVREFNESAKKNAVGKGQPPLTEDEVVAAIRGWIRDRFPATDDVYGAFQKVAHTGALPPGAELSFTTGWRGFNGFDFDVWWVDLTLPVGKGAGYTYRIRDQKLASRPSKK